jgi:hypothetical protein
LAQIRSVVAGIDKCITRWLPVSAVGLVVEGRGGLFEQENGDVLEKGMGDGDALACWDSLAEKTPTELENETKRGMAS